MRRPVVAVDAVHAPRRESFQLLGRQRVFGRHVFGHGSVRMDGLHIGDHFAFPVGVDVINFVFDVHVPMDAAARAQQRVAAADLRSV